MSGERPRKNIAMALAVGTAAVVGGLWLLLNAQGVNVPQFKDLWPVLLILAGVASLMMACAVQDFFPTSHWHHVKEDNKNNGVSWTAAGSKKDVLPACSLFLTEKVNCVTL